VQHSALVNATNTNVVSTLPFLDSSARYAIVVYDERGGCEDRRIFGGGGKC
jgi:hypothetical protein